MLHPGIPGTAFAPLPLPPVATAHHAEPRATDPMICFANSSGYVARFTLDGQPIPGEEVCERVWNTAHADRIRVEGRTGFGWRDICEERLARGESGKVTAIGTSLHQCCRRF